MPRSFFSIASLTTACLAAACFAPPALAQGALKPVEALIVNPANRPVPVTVLSTPAQPGEGSREIYRLALGLEFSGGSFACSGPQSVPAGKRLVLQHLGGTAALFAPAALVYVGIRSQVGGSTDLVVPAAAPVINPSGVNTSAAGQQVHAYFDGDFEVCAGTSALGASRANASLRGYLVNKP